MCVCVYEPTNIRTHTKAMAESEESEVEDLGVGYEVDGPESCHLLAGRARG